MKKILALVLSALMLLTLVACGAPADTTAPDVTEPEATTPENTEPETPAANVILPTMEENTWGAAFWADFETAVAANKGASADVIANAIQMSASGMAMGVAFTMPKEAGFFQGFFADITGFKTAAEISPMMSSTLLVYVFELEESANVREFVSFLNENSDPSWMMCMTADTTTIGAIDNYVLAAYAPTSMPGGAAGAVVIEPTVEAGSKLEALWNEFVSYMEINGSFALSTDVVDTLAMNEAFGENMPVAEDLGESFVIDGFKYAIDGHDNAALIQANGIAVYVIQVEAGLDAWADYYIAGNLSEGAVWGGYGYTYIVIVNA